MRKKTVSNKRGLAQDLRFLMCDTTCREKTSPPEREWVCTAIHCLDRAVETTPPLIVVRFGEIPIQGRESLVELCAALKRNSHTRHCLVLALLHAKHRKLIEDLWQAQVDYVRYISDSEVSSDMIRDIIRQLGPDDTLERHLLALCPFLHYGRIDSRREITLCGAYLDRMALGELRLRQICQTEEHLQCEYYLKPRPTS